VTCSSQKKLFTFALILISCFEIVFQCLVWRLCRTKGIMWQNLPHLCEIAWPSALGAKFVCRSVSLPGYLLSFCRARLNVSIWKIYTFLCHIIIFSSLTIQYSTSVSFSLWQFGVAPAKVCPHLTFFQSIVWTNPSFHFFLALCMFLPSTTSLHTRIKTSVLDLLLFLSEPYCFPFVCFTSWSTSFLTVELALLLSFQRAVLAFV